jgi:hypothetical protein
MIANKKLKLLCQNEQFCLTGEAIQGKLSL